MAWLFGILGFFTWLAGLWGGIVLLIWSSYMPKTQEKHPHYLHPVLQGGVLSGGILAVVILGIVGIMGIAAFMSWVADEL